MNALEQFAISMILGTLQIVIKNPSTKAAVQNQLVGLATDIFTVYGMVPPVPLQTAEVTQTETSAQKAKEVADGQP